MIKEIANIVIRDKYTELTDVSLYSSTMLMDIQYMY